MKKKVFICLIVICTVFICACSKEIEEKVKLENTTYFRFYYSVGNYIDAYVVYELELNEDNKYIASFKDDGVKEEDKISRELGKDEVINLEEIFNKFYIYEWDGFSKADQDVLDGNSFSLSYNNANKISIRASGYMMYPERYREFKEEINYFYHNLFFDETK